MPKPLNAVSSSTGPPLASGRLSEGQQEKQALSAAVLLRNGRAVPGGARASGPTVVKAATTQAAGASGASSTTGLSTTVTLAALTTGGTQGSLVFTGGVLTGYTPAT